MGLAGLAATWGIGVTARNALYNHGWIPTRRVPVPVVSIGNLTLGGTGKTPMVEWVARWYRARGVRVAVLSRGYGGGEGGGVNDEAMVLEENLPDVPHLLDPDRVRIAGIAVEELDTQLLVLDDGFQHRRLARDLDVVLLDALEPFGFGRLFPRGLLREPVCSLRRAGVVVLSRADLVSPADRAALRAHAERHAGPLRWTETRHLPIDVIGTGVPPEPLASLKRRKVAAFCGIGNPDGFRLTLAELCDDVVAFRTFRDHHPYEASDVDALGRWAREASAELVLTTQKDLVKLRVEHLGPVPLRALRIGLEVLDGAENLETALASLLPKVESPPPATE
jgi:tetraacyldisaccharide 4'-kinase